MTAPKTREKLYLETWVILIDALSQYTSGPSDGFLDLGDWD